jgi:hypothetical protein
MDNENMKIGIWSKTEKKLPSNSSEWLLWTLDAMTKASKTRTDYLREINFWIDQYLEGKWVPKEGSHFIHGRNYYRTLHIELIMNVARTIEAFLGVAGICWRISTGTPSKIKPKKLLERLLRPSPDLLEVPRKLFSKKRIEKEVLCQLCAFPLPENLNLEKHDVQILWRIFSPTLKRIILHGYYGVKYLNHYKAVRDSYLHNTRIMYTSGHKLLGAPVHESADIFAIYDPEKGKPSQVLYVDNNSRLALSELSLRLSQMEQLLYQSVVSYIINGGRLVPPHFLMKYPEEYLEDYLRIKRGLRCVDGYPSYRVEMMVTTLPERQMNAEYLRAVKSLQ